MSNDQLYIQLQESTRLFVPYTCNSNLPVCKDWFHRYIQKKGFILEHEFKYISMNFCLSF